MRNLVRADAFDRPDPASQPKNGRFLPSGRSLAHQITRPARGGVRAYLRTMMRVFAAPFACTRSYSVFAFDG